MPAIRLIVSATPRESSDVLGTAPTCNRLRFDGFECDLRTGEIWRNGLRVRLQDQPFQVLRVLLERRGEIVTREELKQILWPADTFVDFDDGLNTAVKKIRDLLGDSAESPRYIETIPRRGYRFVGHIVWPVPVQSTETAESSAPHVPPQTPVLRPAKHRARYIALGGLSLALIFGVVGLSRWRARLFGLPSVPRIESLAVLPLANLSHDPEQDYFADGMTEALIAGLAQVRVLRVISRTSVMHYKGTDKTLPQIARELNVDAVIEGAVQRSGNRVRVTAQLIHGQTDVHLWAKTYERDAQDVLVMQSDLAQAIASEIQVRLTAQEQQRFASVKPINPDAYNAYLLGNFHAAKRSPAAIAKAIAYFQEAIRIDPNYAQGYAGLANVYIEREIWAGVGLGRTADLVRANVLKALELDGELAEAHVLLAQIHFEYDWDWERSEAEFKRAIELNANLPSAYDHYAFLLQAMGRDREALTAAHRAVDLDPLSAWNISDEGRILYRAHQYENAVARYQRALELDPAYLPALARMADAYDQLGDYAQALAYVQKWEQTIGDGNADLWSRARIFARMGKRGEALATLRTIEQNDVSSGNEFRLASIYSALGDHDRAIGELQKLVQNRSSMAFVLRDPHLDPLRSDPRFKQLMRQANLPS